jgi:hypothetical protein
MAKKHKNYQELASYIPRHSYSLHSKQMEPVSLIIIGSRRQILSNFNAAGWYLADNISSLTTLKSAFATLLNSSYRKGPMWPSYLYGRKNQMGLQRPTRADTYRRRHHLRLWKTSLKMNKNRVWAGTISYDRGVGHLKNSLLPIHHISSKLNSEDNFLARTLRIAAPVYIEMGHPEKGHINTGDPYIWDGRALVLDFSRAD